MRGQIPTLFSTIWTSRSCVFAMHQHVRLAAATVHDVLPHRLFFPFRVVIPLFPKRFRPLFFRRSTDRLSFAFPSHLVFSEVSSGHHQHPWFSHGARSTRAVVDVHVDRCFVNPVVVSFSIPWRGNPNQDTSHPLKRMPSHPLKRKTRTR